MATVSVSSFASTYKIASGDIVDIASAVRGAANGLTFWFENSGVQTPFPKWNPESGECSFLRITTNAGAADEAEFLYPICAGANYISFEKFDTAGKLTFVYDATALKDLTICALRILPPLPPLPGIDPRLPPLPPLH